MKILLLADLHIGPSRQSTTHAGIIRQANEQTEETLRNYLTKFNSMNLDLIIQMGDIIRDVEDKNTNLKNLSKGLQLFKLFKAPIINLIGNHDIKGLSIDSLKEKFNDYFENSKFFGNLEFGKWQIIWLDILKDENCTSYLPQERIDWLKKIINQDKQIVIFSHYSLIPNNTIGNFYFDNNPQASLYYKNWKDISRVCKNSNVKLAVNCHSHWASYINTIGMNFITAPSFCENILISSDPNKSPGVYSILEIKDNQLIFKSYSGDYCFFNIEIL